MTYTCSYCGAIFESGNEPNPPEWDYTHNHGICPACFKIENEKLDEKAKMQKLSKALDQAFKGLPKL